MMLWPKKMTQSEHYTVAHEHADCVLPSDLLVMFHMRFQQDFGRSNCEHSCRPIISSTGNTPVVLCKIHLYENRWNRWNMLFFQKFYLPLLKKSYIVSSSPWWWILFKWINDISLCKMTISVNWPLNWNRTSGNLQAYGLCRVSFTVNIKV